MLTGMKPKKLSRSVRRMRGKRLARLQNLSTTERRMEESSRLLMGWRVEARRRANDLGERAVWELANSPAVQERAMGVDPSGELLSELRRVCAEAVAEVAGHHLVSGSRPLADRRRRGTGDKPKDDVVR